MGRFRYLTADMLLRLLFCRWAFCVLSPTLLASCFSESGTPEEGEHRRTKLNQSSVKVRVPQDSMARTNHFDDCFGGYIHFVGGPTALLRYLAAQTALARPAGPGGTVYVRLKVNRSGKVSRAVVLKGVDPILDSTATAITRALPSFRIDSAAVYPDDFELTVPVRFTAVAKPRTK